MMFSTSRIASSTTIPNAITKPARIIVLTRGAGQEQNEAGRQQRQRNGDDADDRSAPLVKEDEDDSRDQQAAQQQCPGQIVDRVLDESRRPEDCRIDLDPWKTGLHSLQRLLHPAGDGERVAPGKLFDDEHEARAVVDDGIANHALRRIDEIGHVAQQQRRSEKKQAR